MVANQSEDRSRRAPRAVILVGIVVGLGAAHAAGWLLSPLLFAALIVVTLFPVNTWMRSIRAPRAVAIIVMLLATFGVLFLGVSLIVVALGQLAALLPDYSQQWGALIADISTQLRTWGVDSEQARRLLDLFDLRAVSSWLTSQIPSLIQAVAMIAFSATVLFFLTIEATQSHIRTVWLRRDKPGLYRSLSRGFSGARRFIGVTTILALAVGLTDTLLLIALDIPLAWLWGLVAVAGNYIPYFGFILGMTPPALLALLIHGPEAMLVVIALYVIINFVITTLIAAKAIGDALDMSMTVEVVSIVFWAWILGPAGAILAVPLTIVLKDVFIDAHAGTAWLRGLVSSRHGIRARLDSEGQTSALEFQ